MRLCEQEPQESEQERKTRERMERASELLGACEGWYVVLVPPQKELLHERLLQLMGFDPFVPIEFRYRRVNSRQKVKRSVPYIMASRYVFLGARPGKPFPWARLFGLGLSVRPLMFDGQLIRVAAETMKDLFDRIREEKERQSAVRLNKSIVVGDTVTITTGPFQGRTIRVDSINEGRAKAVVDLFAKANEVEIPLGDLEAL